MLAAAITPITALLGWLWMRSMDDMDHWQMPYHKWLGTGMAVALVGLAAWRCWLARNDRWPNIAYFIAGLLLVGAVVVQGDLGGAMSFGDGVFVHGEVHEHAGRGSQEPKGHHEGGGNAAGVMHSAGGSGRDWKDHLDVGSTTVPSTAPIIPPHTHTH